jgi:hypothetical protein
MRCENQEMDKMVIVVAETEEAWLPPMAIFNTLSWRFVDKIATGGKHAEEETFFFNSKHVFSCKE